LNALATALFVIKITTTLAKAKEARTFVEPMITKAKENTVHARRHIARFINDREVVQELFGDIVEKVGERPGGYTRVIKLGQRRGDAAEMAILELVDYNEAVAEKPKKKAAPKKKAEKPVAKTKEVEEAEVIEEVENEAETKAEKTSEVEEKTEPAKEAAEKIEETKAVEVKSEEAAPVEEAPAEEKANESKSEEKADSEEEKKK